MNITQKVICYLNGFWTKENIMQDIRCYTLNWFIEKWGWSIEDAHDFYIYVQPQISRGLDTYCFKGKSFLHYLRRLLRFQSRTYNNELRKNQTRQANIATLMQSDYQIVNQGQHVHVSTEQNLWPESANPDSQIEQLETNSLMCQEMSENILLSKKNSAEFNCNVEKDENIMQSLSSEHKRLILRVLQKPEMIDDDVINQLSRKTGVPIIYLMGFREKVFAVIEQRIRNRDNQRDCRTRKLMRICFDDNNPKEQTRLRTHLAKNLSNIRRMNIRPSHRELSEITGLPKGTIGSCLYTQKKKVMNSP